MKLAERDERFGEAFRAQMRSEERPFLGDTTARWRLSLLARGEHRS